MKYKPNIKDKTPLCKAFHMKHYTNTKIFIIVGWLRKKDK